jgi:hypothetical protein
MRTLLLASATLLGLVAAGCITEERIKDGAIRFPGTVDTAGPEDTTEAKVARCRQWVADLELAGVDPTNQASRTIFLVKQLVEHLPFSTTPMLEDGLTHANAKVRENCAFVLCYAQERRAEEALLKLLDDPVETVRLSAAASLAVGYDNRAGVPPLLRALYSGEEHIRREAIKNLKIYTQQYFGYHADAPVAEREFAAMKYQQWWRENGDTFQSPVRGG